MVKVFKTHKDKTRYNGRTETYYAVTPYELANRGPIKAIEEVIRYKKDCMANFDNYIVNSGWIVKNKGVSELWLAGEKTRGVKCFIVKKK